MIEITLNNFQEHLVQASLKTPVLLDIWASWCAPCKQLAPVLEKLETVYNGRFILAKLDADAVPELAGQLSQMFGVRSIPFCVLFKEGQPVDGFVGALTQDKVREFLDKHVQAGEDFTEETEPDELEILMEDGNTQGAIDYLEKKLLEDNNDEDIRFDLAYLLLEKAQIAYKAQQYSEQIHDLDHVQQVLKPALGRITTASRFEALQHYEQAQRQAQQAAQGGTTLELLAEQLQNNPRDFQARLLQAQINIAQGKETWTDAMQALLEIIMRDKTWQDGLPRKLYIALLEILGIMSQQEAAAAPNHAAPDQSSIELPSTSAQKQTPAQALIAQYRRKLSMALN